MRVITFVSVAAFLWSSSVMADQLQWISKENAEKAAAVLKLGPTTILEHCEPCGENDKPKEYAVSTVAVEYTGTDSFYEVKVNGRGLDLAYTYVKTKNFYVNLGRLVDLGSIKTTTTLSNDYVGKLLGQTTKLCGVIDDGIVPGRRQRGGDADLRIKFDGKELILDFVKNPALEAWLQARIPIRGCITYDGVEHQGFEGMVIEIETFSRR